MEPTIVTGVTWDDPLMQVARVPPHNITTNCLIGMSCGENCQTLQTNCLNIWQFCQDELFGPILPILNVNSADEVIESYENSGNVWECKYFEKSWHFCWIFQSQAINLINQREKPLALYVFSEYKEVKCPSRNKKGRIFQPIWQRCKNGSSSAPQVEGSWSMTHSCISGYHLWSFTWSYFVFT